MKNTLRITAIAASFIFLTACERAGFDLDPSITNAFSTAATYNDGSPAQDFLNGIGDRDDNGDLVVPVEHIKGLCLSRPQKIQRVEVDFRPPGETCRWGENGNLDPRDYFFQARIEQKQNLGLPEGAIPCDAHFEFNDNVFLYDDHFMLLFNSTVLASSYDFSSQLEKRSSLLHYDWLNIAGSVWDTAKETIYCPNLDGSQAQCHFPDSDQQGTIHLELDPGHIQGAVANGIPSDDHSFRMVTLGDNNALDCEHTGLSFSVVIRYIE